MSRSEGTLISSLLGLKRLLRFALQLRRESGICSLLLVRILSWRPFQSADQLSLGLALELLSLRLDRQASACRLTHVIAGPASSVGGAEQMTVFMCQAISCLRPDAVILLITHASSDKPPPWQGLPDSVIHLGLARDLPAWATDAFSAILLRDLVLRTRPDCLHVINNLQAWEAIKAYGQALSRITRLYGSVFARSYSVRDRAFLAVWTGHVAPAWPWLSGLCADNQAVLDELDVPDGRERMHCLPSPCRLTLADLEPAADNLALPSGLRPRIIWAGRIAPEKHPELFIELAAHFPGCDFTLFGEHAGDYLRDAAGSGNLHFAGGFRSPREWLAQGRVEALVFTSFWEGLPNVLLEAGILGVPVIAGLVGGVGELLTEQTGYPLPAWAGLAAYQATLAHLLAHPAEAGCRAQAMRELVGRRHTMEAFVQAVSRIDGYVGGGTGWQSQPV